LPKTDKNQFTVSVSDNSLRYGELNLPHGKVKTPCFMSIATRGAVRVAPFSALKNIGAEIILSNTYHLLVRPGLELIKNMGGLHRFIGWDGPILTDSGGFQVFSLAKNRIVNDDGVRFRSVVDGQEILLTPENVVEAQNVFGSDISMVLDEVCALPSSDQTIQKAMERTTKWAERAKDKFLSISKKTDVRPLLFAIVQGGINQKMRNQSASDLVKIGFDGYAIGGLSVGEPNDEMYKTISAVVPLLPEEKPRYLMGVGQPEDIIEAVRRGVDMFDCVLPTRNARHALLYTKLNENYLREILKKPLSEKVDAKTLYEKIKIKNNQFLSDDELVNAECDLLHGVSVAYLRHLFMIGEPMALYLATINNLWFYLRLMEKIRAIIIE
jgi:queuine tRNA-ribosyltransferase